MDFINQIIVNRTPTKHRIQSKPLVFAYFSLSILTERTKSVKTATQEFTIKTSFFPNFVFQVSLGKCWPLINSKYVSQQQYIKNRSYIMLFITLLGCYVFSLLDISITMIALLFGVSWIDCLITCMEYFCKFSINVKNKVWSSKWQANKKLSKVYVIDRDRYSKLGNFKE